MANLIKRLREEGSFVPSLFQLDPAEMFQRLMWDPFREMVPVPRGEAVYTPRFDVKETKDAYLFEADLPGIADKDIEIALTGNRLTVSGKREAEEKHEEENYWTYERSYGSFSRSFVLPEGADLDKLEASLDKGVLTINVPKRPEVQPKKISVKAKDVLEGMVEKAKSVIGKGEKH